jgi:hypothetical protein
MKTKIKAKPIKLKETTWVLGDKPNKTLKKQTGCWTDKG